MRRDFTGLLTLTSNQQVEEWRILHKPLLENGLSDCLLACQRGFVSTFLSTVTLECPNEAHID